MYILFIVLNAQLTVKIRLNNCNGADGLY